MRKLLFCLLIACAPLQARPYFQEIPEKEKETISYIMRTLSETWLVVLPLKRSKVEAAGASTDYLHPLRHLGYIFSTPHLTKAMHKIHSRSLVWKEYWKRMGASLEKEAIEGEVNEAVAKHFAERVGDPRLETLVLEKKWDEMIELCFESTK